jgi:hypothetical protein
MRHSNIDFYIFRVCKFQVCAVHSNNHIKQLNRYTKKRLNALIHIPLNTLPRRFYESYPHVIRPLNSNVFIHRNIVREMEHFNLLRYAPLCNGDVILIFDNGYK